MKRKQPAFTKFAWSDPIYDVSVFLLHGDWEASLKWMDDTFEDVTGGVVGPALAAKTVWIERERGVALVLWFPKWFTVEHPQNLSVLAHECFHAAHRVLSERGIVLSNKSDEAFAYYIAWMFRECYARLK